MILNLTEEQVTQLAPDAASVKAGKGLATKSKWPLLEYSERAIWGHCQGSGSVPYQTVVDAMNVAFGCSCPSRKFPCKHSLGILYLYSSQADLFKAADEPDWVVKWLAKREESAQKKAEKAEQKVKKDSPVDEAAQAKRQATRHKKVIGGIDDLQIWMKDLLRNGLLNVPDRSYTLFDNITRRMVDAQSPGLAGRLRNIQDMNFYSGNWQYELTDKLSRLYLLAESYKHIDQLPDDWQTEIRAQIGYPQAKDEILSAPGVADQWMVVHKTSRMTNDMTTETYWMYGAGNARFATFLSFVVPGTLPEYNFLPGSVYNGELFFYPGVSNLRAIFKSFTPSAESFTPAFSADLSEASQLYRKAILRNPFAEEVPMLVENLILTTSANQFFVQDTAGKAMPVRVNAKTRLDLLSITGGEPFAAFFLVDADCWKLKTIWYQSDYYFWKDEFE